MTISGVLERKVCLRTAIGPLYPNLFVLLVARPGIGKSNIIRTVRAFWAGCDGANIAPQSTTRAGMIAFLIDAKRIDTSRPLPTIVHSALCASSEFGNLVPSYDTHWLNTVNELYDCPEVFDDKTLSKGSLHLEGPHMVIIAGTQPKYIDQLFPDAAFGMGTPSRFIMAYESDAPHISLFAGVEKSEQKFQFLKEDLARISALRGEFYWSPEGLDLWEELDKQHFAPQPTHSKLQHYNTRRRAHLLKTTMCFSAAESNSLRLTPAHLKSAVTLLHETETQMPQIFQEMASKGYAEANEEAWRFAMQTWLTNGRKPISETQLTQFLLNKVPNGHIKPTLDIMIQAGYLRVMPLILPGQPPAKGYIPLDRR